MWIKQVLCAHCRRYSYIISVEIVTEVVAVASYGPEPE